MFAIDGVKLSSNASKEWSGTKEDLRKKKEKLEAVLNHMIQQHRKCDVKDNDNTADEERFKKRLERARKKIEKLDTWLETNNDKVSSRRYTKQSNVTDNESAKMKSSHGVIQGYNGIAMVDAKHQVIVSAEAFGQGHDTSLLQPAVEGAKKNLAAIGHGDDCLQKTVVTADTGFHSSDNLQYLEEEAIDGYVPDSNFRKRDPRFATAPRHKEKKTWGSQTYSKEDFEYVNDDDYFICPAGQKLTKSNSDLSNCGITYYKYNAKQRICGSCDLRPKCIQHQHPRPRSLFRRSDNGNEYTERMRNKIDTIKGREIYSKRMSVVEPVFGNIRWAKGMHRFTLRGKTKVNTQWNLYCIVHNIEKICNFGVPVLV
jgi:hypothetical protein